MKYSFASRKRLEANALSTQAKLAHARANFFAVYSPINDGIKNRFVLEYLWPFENLSRF